LIDEKVQVNTGLNEVEDLGVKGKRGLVMGVGTGLFNDRIELLDLFHLKFYK
jgi:hypothetical protein